jgi:Carboxypeptidase regulatory-like domain
LFVLPNLRIASPCKADWNQMQGDERVRHCFECNLDVYNFSTMPEREIQRLLLAKNERVCARWYRRSDGTIITADCPVGFRARVRKISLVAGTALSALLSLSPAAAQTSDKTSDSTAKTEKNDIGSGVIPIRVMDETGAVIPRAQVTVLDSANRSVAEGQTDESGNFQTRGLKSGSYSIQAIFPGFHKSESHGILVESNKKPATVLMRLGVAVMGEVLIVGDRLEIEEGSGDVPLLLPLAPAPKAVPAPKPTPMRRLFSKIKGNTK